MDLTSYAELAVRLVNTGEPGDGRPDQLATVEAYRALVADHANLSARVIPTDLDALRQLRAELRLIFMGCAADDAEGAVARLNALLARHPIHPEVARDGEGTPWHLHHANSGSAADRYAAGAIMGLAGIITMLGPDRLRTCQAGSCPDVFVDTSTRGARRFCSDRCAAKVNVTTLRRRRRSQDSDRASTAAV